MVSSKNSRVVHSFDGKQITRGLARTLKTTHLLASLTVGDVFKNSVFRKYWIQTMKTKIKISRECSTKPCISYCVTETWWKVGSRTAIISWNWLNIVRTNVLYRWNMHFKFMICYDSVNIIFTFMHDQKVSFQTLFKIDLLWFFVSNMFLYIYVVHVLDQTRYKFLTWSSLSVCYTNLSVVQKQLQKKTQQFHDGTSIGVKLQKQKLRMLFCYLTRSIR